MGECCGHRSSKQVENFLEVRYALGYEDNNDQQGRPQGNALPAKLCTSTWKNICEEIKTKLDAVYGNPSPYPLLELVWFKEFKRSQTSVFDEGCPGRLADMVIEENTEKVHDRILSDRRTKVREGAIGVSPGTVFNSLNVNLKMRENSSTCLLTANNKRVLLTTIKQCLEQYKRFKIFLPQVVAVEETYVMYFLLSETNQESTMATIINGNNHQWQQSPLASINDDESNNGNNHNRYKTHTVGDVEKLLEFLRRGVDDQKEGEEEMNRDEDPNGELQGS
ncbi:NIPBL [Cordylochernes scorpioides]|uniref:NIPBL n=1 Tax=Cordylochernes scorpioides TaxID=51811 RepID=A0ABY6LU29_9ARAC|nr:NIPBL [Cordylochernes scorpioides]